MRIIAGKYRGRKLVSFQAGHIRPTTDRVKESLFNKIAPYIEGARVLDLFAGTGNLGIEALSRGAAEVVFVEKSGRSLQILKKNLTTLGINEDVKVVKDDVFKFVKKWDGAPFDVVLADPPFTEKIAHPVMEILAQFPLVTPEGLIVIESSHQEPIGENYPPYNFLDRRSFGDKNVSFFSMPEK
ncbi:MAG: 16S rRNA (guanine(966)-N(2))-methyltransferase RsmD [Bdellovibrionaceae bacterium]|nr:16S rRNA (guanine(966)-N(2))-methyltransferase RsmD [Bdellovibrionales bacterium]MCB9084833.1 16S rRNA (guanine(966)-N(2))-methyltransferase RsmD [Pseudobdellovibrionaceae bacterium]